MTKRVLALLLALPASVAACGGDDTPPPPACDVDETYNPPIVASNFVTGVNNPFFPLVPGTTWRYMEGANTVDVTVTTDTKVILGVTCIVVRDTVRAGTEVIEDTFDWYAQDGRGNVWYLGEDTTEFAGGMPTTKEGSWEGGVDGAKPGIIIPGMPMVGQSYRQEYYACHAEDMGEILTLDASVTVPLGMYTGCIQTRDTTPLHPDAEENKWYCSGLGIVLSVDLATDEREELISMTP